MCALQVQLIRVFYDPKKAATGEDVRLRPAPQYSVPSDNMVMVSVASTPSGRIFMGGTDGNLYELDYRAKDSWRTKRIQKV